jgi:hypothetical protein
MLPLAENASPCVNSGFCCKIAPCPFGEVVSDTDRSCKFLVEVEQEQGKHPRYICGKYDEIIQQPGWELAPAFGAGCCMTLFNHDRAAILKELKE